MTNANIRLRTFRASGDPNEVVKTVTFGGGPNTPRRQIPIRRADFISFVQKVLEDRNLVGHIVSYWDRQIKHVLAGGVNSGYSFRPYQKVFHELAQAIGGDRALAISSILAREVEILVLHQSVEMMTLSVQNSISFEFVDSRV